jgi:hypothetical protein
MVRAAGPREQSGSKAEEAIRTQAGPGGAGGWGLGSEDESGRAWGPEAARAEKATGFGGGEAMVAGKPWWQPSLGGSWALEAAGPWNGGGALVAAGALER